MKQTQMYSIEDEQLSMLVGIMFAIMAVIIGVVVAFSMVTWVLVFATSGV